MDSSQLPSNAASPTGPVTSSTSAPLSVRDDPTPTSPPLSTSSGGKRPTPTHTPSSEGTVDDANTIKMVSPVGGETLYIDWNKDIGDNSELLAYLFDIMKRCMVVQSIALGLHSKREIMERKHGGWTFEEAKEVFDAFNKTATQVSKLWKGATIPGLEAWSQDRCDAQLITFITNMAFNCAIKSPRALNRHYAPWTSETYGETSIAQMQKIIDQIGFTEHDVFVDLGSGVGQLITYVAGATRVKKVVGVECAALPFSYSESMQFEFNRLMKWFKKRHQKYELIKGDFMEAKFRDLITREATIIFINNYAFTPALDTRIKHELLQHCRDGAKIVTTKKYAEGKESLTDRDMGDIEAMVDVTMLTTVEQPVSWTDKVVPYFLHTINRGKIERYFMEKKNNSSSALSQMAADSRRASLSSKESASNSSHGSREGSQIRERYSRQDKQELLKTEIVTAAGEEPTSGPLLVGSSAVSSSAMDSDASTMAAVVADVVGFGPTTRKQWKEYVEGSNKIKKTASPRGSSPRWNEPDRDYTPSAKKAKKAANNLPTSSAQLQHASVGPMAKTPSKATGAKKGRPRLSGHRLSGDAKEGMAEMHSLIVSPKPIQDQDSPNLVRIALNSSGSGAGSDGNAALGSPDQLLMRQRHEQLILNDPNQFGANHLQQPRLLQQSMGPGQIGNGTLNLPPGYLLLNIENDLDRVVIDYFYALRNHLEQMMSEEYIRGLYDDINREQIRHRTLEEKVSAQEAVVQQILSMGVQHLKNRLSELDMDHVTEVTELLQGSKRIVAHHKELHQRVSSQETENASLEAKLRNVCPYGDRIVEKLHLLDQNDNAAIDADKYIMLIQQTAIETGHPIPKLEPDPIDPNEVIANTQPAKRPRQRPRAGPGGKRGKPEENSEEMERQIQEIVQAALRVDSVAKEKERRARGGGAAAAGSSFGNAPLAPEQRQQRISSGSAIGPTNGNNSALATPTDPLSSMGLHPSLVSSIQNQGILGGQPQPNQGQNPQSVVSSPITSQPI